LPEALAFQPSAAGTSSPFVADLPPLTVPAPALVQTETGNKADWLTAFQGSMPVIVGVWSVGVVLLSLRLLAGLWRVWQ
jgi:hypothetical protein